MDVSQEANVSTEAANAEPENTVTQAQPDVVETEAEKAVRLETHTRVLEESRKYKQRMKDAEKRLEEIERAKLEEQGKHKEVAETYKQQLENQRQINLKLAVRQAVSGPANRAGCIDLDDLLKLGDQAKIEYDPDTGEVYGADAFVEAMKTNRPYLFHQANKTVVNPAVPGGTPTTKKKETFEDALLKAFTKK